MAYKFQLGSAKLGGSVTSTGAITGAGLDAGDGDVTNVGSIKLDSIQADADGDGTMDIILTDDKAAALEVKEDTNLYLRLSTDNGSEGVEIHQNLEMQSGTKFIMPDVTSGKILVADGTSFEEVALSGDATIDSSGALTIANNAVEAAMINTAVAGLGLTGGGGSALAVQVSGAVKIATDKVGITGSFAGAGLSAVGGADSISSIDINTRNQNGLDIDSSNRLRVKIDGSSGLALDSGGLTIDAGGVVHGMLADDIISGQAELAHADILDADELMISDGGVIKRVGVDSLRDHFFGVVSSDATVADGGALTIANDAVSFAKMQNISNQRVLGRVNDGDNTVAELTPAQLIGLFNSDLGGNFTIGNQADDTLSLGGGLTVGGDLTVNGTVTTVNSTTINITSSFTFEGPADAHETTLGVVDPTADATIKLPAMGAGTYFLPVLSAASTVAITSTPAEINVLASSGLAASDMSTLATLALDDVAGLAQADFTKLAALDVSAAELNLLDADTAMETNPVGLEASDNFLLFDDSASNAPKRARLQDIVELAQKKGILEYDAGSLADASNTQLGLADANKVVRASSALGADKTINLILPDIDANNLGEVFMIKAPTDCSGDRKVVIKVKTSTDKIDGVANQTVSLESPNAAVTLVVVSASEFAIF